ncbi:MAG TPA: adenosylcobinamide-phosphate synthase CbiB [Nocardioides sp.]|nr:adenosylcobinamide-phosphate synthase CbiB [Nocardioides sp.]
MSVLVAATLDVTLAEPPARLHPVVWTGRYLDGVARAVPAEPALRARLVGAAAWGGGALVAVLAGRVVGRGGFLLRGAALWPLLSARMLMTEVLAVEAALSGDVNAGRAALARIVSRDTGELSPTEVRAAAIESLAENLSDSVVAPLFWHAIAGLPGAAFYRYANTADACWGYRTPRWRYAGLVAARVDDVLNAVPARLTAALLRGTRGWGRLRAEARKTASPNAGWPMAALALRLDLRLSKRDHYELNPTGADPDRGDVAVAVRTARRAAVVAVVGAAALEHLSRREKRAR